jgi:hypothetical protein
MPLTLRSRICNRNALWKSGAHAWSWLMRLTPNLTRKQSNHNSPSRIVSNYSSKIHIDPTYKVFFYEPKSNPTDNYYYSSQTRMNKIFFFIPRNRNIYRRLIRFRCLMHRRSLLWELFSSFLNLSPHHLNKYQCISELNTLNTLNTLISKLSYYQYSH